MGYIKYIAKRSLYSVILLFLVASALFIGFRLLPGDISAIFIQSGADAETVARLEEKWGLNDPLYVQWWNYMQNLILLDPGQSFRYSENVWELTKWRLANSLILVAPAITAAYIIGSGLGGLLGKNRGSRAERWGISGAIMIGAAPAFFTGIVLIVIFAEFLNLFPSGGAISTDTARQLSTQTEGSVTPIQYYQTTDFWWHYTLPFITIFIKYLYRPMLIMRTNVGEIADQGFMYYHRLTGITPRREVGKLIKHASLPVITLYPASMTRAIGGMVLVEVVFNWPGIGSLLVDSVLSRDFPVVQFIFFLVAAWVILGNFVVDIVYSIIDPRVQLDD